MVALVDATNDTSSYHLKTSHVTDDGIGIRVLHNAPCEKVDVTNASKIIDIVGLHEIGVQPDNTRCNGHDEETDAGYKNWLQDPALLPDVIPDSRIMRFGYHSKWLGDDNIAQHVPVISHSLLTGLARYRKNHEDRPLILIAHGSGGLVLMHAMNEAKRNDLKWAGIYRSTSAMIFFATPSLGSLGVAGGSMLQAAMREYAENHSGLGNRASADSQDQYFFDLLATFKEARQDKSKPRIVCFWESNTERRDVHVELLHSQTLKVRGSTGYLDETDSTENYALQGSHGKMNEVVDPSDEDWLIVSKIIKDTVDWSLQQLRKRKDDIFKPRVLGQLYDDESLPASISASGTNRNSKQEVLQVATRLGVAESILRSINVRRNVSSSNQADTLAVTSKPVMSLEVQRKYREPENLPQYSLDDRTREKNDVHGIILESMSDLANHFWEAGDTVQAELMCRQVVEGKKQFYGVNHEQTLLAMNDFAVRILKHLPRDGVKLYNAEQLMRQVMRTREKYFPSDVKNLFIATRNLLSIMDAKKSNDDYTIGNCNGVDSDDETLFNLSDKVLGQNHPHTLSQAQSLLDQYDETKDNERAAKLTSQILGSKVDSGASSLDFEVLSRIINNGTKRRDFKDVNEAMKQTLDSLNYPT